MITYVILHYLTNDDTSKCVKSIQQCNQNQDFNIVIVDNASHNESFLSIKEEFSNLSNVYFIENDYNMGFAQGNNIGYDYAKNILKASFIVILNNDIIVKDREIYIKIKESYKKYNYHIMGPDIISLIDEGHQNPLSNVTSSKKEIYSNITRYTLLLLLNYIYIEELIIKLKKKLFFSKQEKLKVENFNEIKENIPLHGSFLIFSPSFIIKNNEAFDGRTFLFLEEDILFYKAKINNYKTLYYPEICVLHKEDSSTDFLTKSKLKKRRFIYKNLIKSSLVLKRILK
ncbi:glycosyltransferase [Priestia aryabhattai]|uniref:glycosyltransferase n=1 Tax=Priestia aryabhattai TaxID=412384 RepID=UPI002E235388|nr:glycosyltransferase [Priestia aryabhattai]